jgi:hypothetical protein
VCASSKAKSNAFIQEYAEVSGRKSRKDSRRVVVDVSKALRAEGQTHEVEKPFTLQELKVAIGAIRNRKAAGPDGIKSDLMKNLPHCAQ